jgi:menaquinone-dependent protoporphyrinogen IX oxidase
MAKAIIIYESKYGNTRQVSGLIAEGMRQVRGTEVTLAEVGQVDLNNLATFDVILIGSPNHMGGPTGNVRKSIDQIKLKLENKKIAVFDTYMSKDFEKAIKKMEKQIAEKSSGLVIAAPGLSVRVDGMKGPITEGELIKCREFGVNIAKGL